MPKFSSEHLRTISEEGLANATAHYVYSSLLRIPQVAEAESPNCI